MKFLLRTAALCALLLLIIVNAAAQGESTVYTDPQGRFSLPVPTAWSDESSADMAHFVSADGSAHIYALAVENTDVRAGVLDAMAIIHPGFDKEPIQSNDAPLPGGRTWRQHIFILDSGEIAAALGYTEGEITYVLVAEGPQTALAAINPVIIQSLMDFTIGGESATTALPDYIDPESFTEQEITLKSGEYELPAALTIPNGEGPFPAVVMVSGSGPNDRDETLAFNKPFRDIAQGLATQGIVVLRYDKRTKAYGQQIAAMTDFTIDDEYTDDALAALELVKTVEQVNPEQVFILGHSQGAILTPRIAERAENLAGAIMLAGSPRTFDELLDSQIAYLTENGQAAGLESITDLSNRLKELREGGDAAEIFANAPSMVAYFPSIYEYDAAATAQSLELPILVMQGERDYQATMDDFNAWKEILAENDATFISYPTLNHVFMALGDLDRLALPADYNEPGFVDELVITDLANWINSQE